MKDKLKHSRKLNNKNAILIAVAAVALSASSAFAQAICTVNTNWTAGAGNWFTAGNWDHGVPNSTTGATINNGGTAQIGSSLHANACSLILGNDISNSGTVSVGGFAGLTVGDTAIIGNKGTGNLSIVTGGTVASGNATIAAQAGELWTSTGTVTLNAGSSWTISGNLSLGAGNATMAFGVTPTSGSAVPVTVSGTASLNTGKHLVITFGAGSYTVGSRYTLIATTLGRSGMFSTTTFINTPPNICPRIAYDSRNVYLDLLSCTP
jgi:hypothetical protein